MARPKNKVNRVQAGLRLRSDLLKALRHLAVDEEKQLNVLVEEAIEDCLRKYGQEVPVTPQD